MKMALVTIAASALLAASTAWADQVVGSAPAFGSGQTVAVCYFANISDGTIKFSGVQVHREFGALIPVSTTNCETLGPFASCQAVANLGGGEGSVAHWCVAEVSNKKFLRGRLEIRDGLKVLTSEEIR